MFESKKVDKEQQQLSVEVSTTLKKHKKERTTKKNHRKEMANIYKKRLVSSSCTKT